MSKSFFGVIGGFQADNNKRVSVSGKDAILMEVVDVAATAGAITLYRADYTTYIKTPAQATTGAAVLQDIKHVLWVGGGAVEGAPNDATTTLDTAVFQGVEYVNGPTTVAIIGVHNNADDVMFRILVCGKSF